jgi:8-oxo-dGTP pyrophosphatase MutT (NUDIX family)
MKRQELHITVKKAFGNLYRKRCVLIAVQDAKGKILIGAKPYFYPPTIARLLGGGVDAHENLEQAVVRELQEELGVTIEPTSLAPLVLFATYATDEDGNKLRNDTYVYRTNIGDQQFQAGDDVKHIIKLTVDELYQLGEQYEGLSDSLWYNGVEGMFSWANYAKMYGPVHKIAAEEIKKLS